MIALRLIALCCTLALQGQSSLAIDSESVLNADENLDVLLLFNLMMKNSNMSITEEIPSSNKTSRNSSVSTRIFIINPGPIDPFVPPTKFTGETNGSALLPSNETLPLGPLSAIDFSSCGTYPACQIQGLTDRLWSFTCDRHLVSFSVAMESILCVVVIVSNAVIIIVTLRTAALRKPHGYFKLSLAIADSLAGLFVLPSIIHNTLTRIDFGNRVYTSRQIASLIGVDETYTASGAFFGVMGLLTTIVSIYSLLLLSVDRFLSVRWPLQYRSGGIVTNEKALIAIVFVWLFSLMVGFLPIVADDLLVYGLSYLTFQYLPLLRPLPNVPADASVAERYLHAVLYTVFVWGIPFVVTWILTVLTSVEGRRMLKNMREARRKSVRSKRVLHKVDRDLIRTVVVLLTLFTITILPVFGVLVTLIVQSGVSCYSRVTVTALFTANLVFICGRFLNVIVYNVFNKDFRKASSQLFSDTASFIFCRTQSKDDGLPQPTSNAKKPVSFWKSEKSARSVTTKETAIRTASASTSVSTTEKALLSQSIVETTTATKG